MEVESHWRDMVYSRGRLHGDGHLMVPGVCHILDICDRICDTSCHLIIIPKLKENKMKRRCKSEMRNKICTKKISQEIALVFVSCEYIDIL